MFSTDIFTKKQILQIQNVYTPPFTLLRLPLFSQSILDRID